MKIAPSQDDVAEIVQITPPPAATTFALAWLTVCADDETEFALPPNGVPPILNVAVAVPLSHFDVIDEIMKPYGALIRTL